LELAGAVREHSAGAGGNPISFPNILMLGLGATSLPHYDAAIKYANAIPDMHKIMRADRLGTTRRA